MRNFVFALAIALIALPTHLLWAQLTENRDLPSFQAVKNMGSVKVILQQGNKETALIQTEKADLKDVITEVADGELRIHFKNKIQIGWNNNQRGAVTVIVTYKNLEGVRNTGSGKIICEDIVRSQNFDLKQSGSGHILLSQLEITQNLKAKVSGSGQIQVKSVRVSGITQTEISGSGNLEILEGITAQVEAKVSGSGGLHISGLEAQNANTKISGSGRMRLAVMNHLEAKVSGSGSIYYKNKPQSISTNISGSGRVKLLENK